LFQSAALTLKFVWVVDDIFCVWTIGQIESVREVEGRDDVGDSDEVNGRPTDTYTRGICKPSRSISM